MKFRTILASSVGVAIGYVLGARAGRTKFDELKAQAQRIVNDPDVRQKVSDLPNQVRENLPKAQAVVTEKLKGAADKAQSATSDDTSDANASTGAATTGLAASGLAATGDLGSTSDSPWPADPVSTGDAATPDRTLDPDAPLGGESLGVDDLGTGGLGDDGLSADAVYPDDLGSETTSIDDLGTEPLGTEPLGTEPLGSEFGTDELGSEPLGSDPVFPDEGTEAPTGDSFTGEPSDVPPPLGTDDDHRI